MTKTIRWYNKLGISYNPYWYRHEVIYIRSLLHRRFRHNNRVAINNSKKLINNSKMAVVKTCSSAAPIAGASRLAGQTPSAMLSKKCLDIQTEPKTRGWITF